MALCEFIIYKCKTPATISVGRKISFDASMRKFDWKYKVSGPFESAVFRIVSVAVPPSIDQLERHYTGTVGQPLKLSCQANGIPIPHITWQGIHNASGTATVDSFGNLFIDQLE